MRAYDLKDESYLRKEKGMAAPDINRNSGIIISQKRNPSHGQCLNCVLKNSATPVSETQAFVRIQYSKG